MMPFVFLILLCLFVPLCAQRAPRTAQEVSVRPGPAQKDYIYDPWYTGPLLSPSATTIPKGEFNLQPYLYVIQQYGEYTKNSRYQSVEDPQFSLNPLAFLQYGINSWMDAAAIFQMYTNYQSGQSSTNYGDTYFRLGAQILRDKKGSSQPDIKFNLGIVFPTGKYQNLSPDNFFNQDTGSGSYQILTAIAFQKFFSDFRLFPWTYNPYRVRLSIQYRIPTPVIVSNFNTYGGGFGTYGTVYPGNILNIIGAFEFSFTQKWGFALDLEYVDTQRSTFQGRFGSIQGVQAQMGLPSSNQVSVAPAIEYNLSDDFGFIGGVWLSLGGRNTAAFISYIFSFDWEF